MKRTCISHPAGRDVLRRNWDQ